MKYTLFHFYEICRCYNENMFLDDLEKAAVEKCGLTRAEPILLGISGGADSLALLAGLAELGFNLVIAHLDHALRSESDEDAVFVKSLAASRGLPCVSERVEVGDYAAENSLSLEEAAREVRYRFLFTQARRFGVQAVAVAHHADDQVETVLMHFLRGAGLPGLSGMAFRRTLPAWDDEIPLVRPLLGIWREEIEAFVAGAGLTPREDATNQDLAYFRNRLRHVLLPDLAAYNPRIREVLWRTAAVLGEEDGYLAELAADAWRDCLVAESQDMVQWDLQAFRSLATALQRRVLRRGVARLRPDERDFGFEAVEKALAFAGAPAGRGEIDLAARLNLALIGNRLILKSWAANLPDWDQPLLVSSDQQADLSPETPVELRHGWRIEMAVLDAAPERLLTGLDELAPYESWLDADRLIQPLRVRGRHKGERWQPLGMAGHTQSLQDFFINEKVPEHLREVWPLVCSGDQVAWVAGMRPSEACKVGVKTKLVVHLRLVR